MCLYKLFITKGNLIMERTCKHCSVTFNESNGKVFSNHVRWCKSNPDRNNSSKSIGAGVSKANDKKYGKVSEFTKICKCGNSYVVECREGNINKSRYVMQHCSMKCANTRVHSDETKAKIRDTLEDTRSEPEYVKRVYPNRVKTCPHCSSEFTGRRKYCSDGCKLDNTLIHLDNKNRYKRDCKFKFSLQSFPCEFEFDLITKYGWYKAKNRGDNVNGVSRDHMIPVVYGWKHGISPEIISHPANCKLMRHSDNVSKGIKPSISLEALCHKIEKWNKIYNQ
jgi:hypothetical protein